MTPERIAELKKLAEAATPGPYELGGLGVYSSREDNEVGPVCNAFETYKRVYSQTQSNANYLAATDPQTVLELLAALEESEKDCLEQARLNGIGAEREAKLLAELEEAKRAAERLKAERETFRRIIREIFRAIPDWDDLRDPGNYTKMMTIVSELVATSGAFLDDSATKEGEE